MKREEDVGARFLGQAAAAAADITAAMHYFARGLIHTLVGKPVNVAEISTTSSIARIRFPLSDANTADKAVRSAVSRLTGHLLGHADAFIASLLLLARPDLPFVLPIF